MIGRKMLFQSHNYQGNINSNENNSKHILNTLYYWRTIKEILYYHQLFISSYYIIGAALGTRDI